MKKLFGLPVLARVMVIALVGVLVLGAMTVVGVHMVNAVPVQTFIDSDGANDEPGQKDLTQATIDLGSIDPLYITWNWDITTLSGANTADACALFDTDGDNLANYALCMSWFNGLTPSEGYPVLYMCNDTRTDRCAGGEEQIITGDSSCTLDIGTSPFSPLGDDDPADAVASCTIYLDDVGGSAVAELLDVCSYPSLQPNSDPSDCVVISQDKGNLEVIKDVVPDDSSTNWDITVTGNTAFTDTLIGDDTTDNRAVVAGLYSITESSLTGYTSKWSCTNYYPDPVVTQSGTGTSIPEFPIGKGDIWVCTFTNTANVDLAITKSDLDYTKPIGPDGNYILNVGEKFTYYIEVDYPATAGTGAKASDVTVVDTLDPFLKFIGPASIEDPSSMGRTCEASSLLGGGTVTCDLVEMMPGENVSISFEVEVLPGVETGYILEIADATYSCSLDNADLCNSVIVTTTSNDVCDGVGEICNNNQYDEPADIGVPTAVELLYFEGTGAKNSVILEWATASELDTIGFNLYRRGRLDGTMRPINTLLIQAISPGAVEGAAYTFKVKGLVPSKYYYFWLEDVDIYGNTTLHGPIYVKAKNKNP